MKGVKFLFTGPECSGKTTIATWAAGHWGGLVVPEFAPLHLQNINRPYEFEDLLVIANQQLMLEKLAERKGISIFCDTSLLVIHVWMLEKYSRSLWEHGFDYHHLHDFDHVYLCRPDMVWESSDFRENPEDRSRLFELYQAQLNLLGVSFTILEGPEEYRKETLRSSFIQFS
jgi:nicotinamide riboside kinase